MAEAAKWYVVHTYSGYENTVKATIEKTVQSRQLQDQIITVAIPQETVTEITDAGVSKTYDRKLYPGYVFVKMVYSDDTWHVIRNVRGVAGFVGASGNDPFPLTDDEVYEMGVEKREIIVNYAVGDTVRILDGPLSSFTGVVESLEVDKNTVSVVVSMFGRETPVEFELDQVEAISQ
jgi:transcriptional antiterminator NusG